MGMDLLSLAPASLLSQISERDPSRNPRGSRMASRAAQASGSTGVWSQKNPKSRSQISHSLAVRLRLRASHLAPLCPSSSVEGGKNTYPWDVIYIKGRLCGRSFLSGSRCHCFPFNLTPDSCFGSSAETRKAPHRSPVRRFGWHDEGGVSKLPLHYLHQPPQEPFMGAKEVSFPWTSGGHVMGRPAQDVLCQSQVRSKVLSAVFGPSCPFLLCAQAPGSRQPSPRAHSELFLEKTSQDGKPGFPGLFFLDSHQPDLL